MTLIFSAYALFHNRIYSYIVYYWKYRIYSYIVYFPLIIVYIYIYIVIYTYDIRPFRILYTLLWSGSLVKCCDLRTLISWIVVWAKELSYSLMASLDTKITEWISNDELILTQLAKHTQLPRIYYWIFPINCATLRYTAPSALHVSSPLPAAEANAPIGDGDSLMLLCHSHARRLRFTRASSDVLATALRTSTNEQLRSQNDRVWKRILHVSVLYSIVLVQWRYTIRTYMYSIY